MGDAAGEPANGIATRGARLLAGVVRLADALRLRLVLRRCVRALPQSLGLSLVQTKLRTGYTHGLILVPGEDLESSRRATLAPDTRSRPASTAYLEFSALVGTSMACMYRAASAASTTGLRLIGFDSFQEMPAGVAEQADGRWRRAISTRMSR